MSTSTYGFVMVYPRELRLGDKVKLFEGDYGTGTVFNVEGGAVSIIRPYIHTADFSYTGGVQWYIGTETVKVSVESERCFELIERGRELR